MSKICIISPMSYPLIVNETTVKSAGGAEAQLTVLGEELEKRDYDVHYIVGDYGQERTRVYHGLSLHKVPFKYMGGSNLFIVQSWFLLIWTLIKISPDCILIKLPRHLLFPIGIYRKIFRKSILFIGQIDHDTDLNEIRKIEGRINAFLYKAGIKWVDYAIAQNKNQCEGFRTKFGLDSKIIKSIITLPMDRDIKKDNYILWVGNSLPKKQPDLFLEIAKKLPGYQFKMIVSPAEGGMHQEIEKQASEIDNLDYLGFVPFSEISGYFKQSRLFVSTSLREGFPNTFLQSWQYGTPVLSLNIDPDNVISDYQLGVLANDVNSAIDAIHMFFSDQDYYNQCSRNVLNYVDNFHTKDVVVDKYVDVITGLVKK